MNLFLAACEEGNFDEIRTMLQTDSTSRSKLLREKDSNGWTCLHWAAWHSDIEWMRYLLAIKELDITVTNKEGKTAFHVAMNPHKSEISRQHASFYTLPSLDILRVLLEVNIDFVNYCARYGRLNLYPIEYAIMVLHIDAVKMLVQFGGRNVKSNYTILHNAALNRRIDCIRYLIYELDYDPRTRCLSGRQACCVFFREILHNWLEPSKQEIEFSLELLSITHKEPAEAIEVCFLLIECFRMRHNYPNDFRARIIFMKIVRLLLPTHRRQHLIEKILQLLPGSYCLITLTLFENVVKQNDNFNVSCSLATPDTYVQFLDEMKSYFMQELFAIYSVDETFFNEYIDAIMEIGWTFSDVRLMTRFCASLIKEKSSQKIFNFMKILIMKEVQFVLLVHPQLQPLISLMPSLGNHLLKVFVPLSSFLNAPIDLLMLLRGERRECHYNFNESENCINDYTFLVERPHHQFEVVSLKNLSRMSVRKYVFDNFPHREALSIIYSVNIPIELRQFLCYNYANLKF